LIGHKYFGDLSNGGKIGNQLFEYAALFNIAKKNNYQFGFSEKQVEYFRKCFLFRSAEILSHEEYLDRARIMTHRAEDPPVDLTVLDAKDNTLLEGFFQSEQYFEDSIDELKRELSYHPVRLSAAQTVIRDLKYQSDNDIVSVHYRKGDYVLNDFPCLPVEYYLRSFAEFEPDRTTFIICSDELKTAKEVFDAVAATAGKDYNIILSPYSEDVGPEFWNVKGEQTNSRASWNPVIDMSIMSMSDHCIIANSSLSWWGSWFYDRPGKRVLAPPIWFKGVKTVDSAIRRDKWEIIEF